MTRLLLPCCDFSKDPEAWDARKKNKIDLVCVPLSEETTHRDDSLTMRARCHSEQAALEKKVADFNKVLSFVDLICSPRCFPLVCPLLRSSEKTKTQQR